MKNIEIWKEIHRLARELYLMAPWSYISETDIFGVKTAANGNTYFISIMGSAEELSAICAYEGPMALEQFWELEEEPMVEPERILVIPHIMLSFDYKKNIDDLQKDLLKKTEYNAVKGRSWPELKRIIPGLVPAIPGDQHLVEFPMILEQVIDVCSRAKKDISFIHQDEQDDDIYLIREQAGKGGKTVWFDNYLQVPPEKVTYKPGISEEDAGSLRFLKKTSEVLQAGYRMMPTPVRDSTNPDYFPFVVMLTDKKSGIIEGFELISPSPDYHSMVEKIPLSIINMIKKLKLKPMSIEISNGKLYEMLEPILRKSQINVKFVTVLVSLEEAFEGMMENMRKK